MIGSIGSLVLLMPCPALAGVWDHSNFRQDMFGSLRRTANLALKMNLKSVERNRLAVESRDLEVA
ncbi:oxygenase MpaB family protein [Hansschlegelia plantiphila]|uniref:oxygenase MpaB family protein n=1 Tax=Hansschlegelia plantiphila TaxID=374655 RepID=UPI003204AFB1